MRRLLSTMLLLVGLVHLMPLVGVLGAQQLESLYGMDFSDPDLLILMRHRAVLFGLLGLFLVVSAWRPEWQRAATLAGLASVASFLWLAWLHPQHNAHLERVVAIDVGALFCLFIAAGCLVCTSRR